MNKWLARSFQKLNDSPLSAWVPWLQAATGKRMSEYLHGQLYDWLTILETLPMLGDVPVCLQDKVGVGRPDQLDSSQLDALKHALMQLHPWRKGPFHLFGLCIDTEWRSDWKWERIQPHIDSLDGRRVLDIGCGNGYHLWRMRGEGADWVLGVDPSQLFWCQFLAIQHFIRDDRVHHLPIGFEHLPRHLDKKGFDSVFCMGVLYHRKDPINFIATLRDFLRPGGQLILETLVVEGDANTVLVPTERYARMNNVWSIPSSQALCHWLAKLSFDDIRVVDVTPTTTEEQRRTEWMTFESLAESLMPDGIATVEGHPAPIRATICARKRR